MKSILTELNVENENTIIKGSSMTESGLVGTMNSLEYGSQFLTVLKFYQTKWLK